MAKQLGTGAKVAIWIGVLATVGVSGYFIHQAYKKWKANKNGEQTDLGAGINDIVIPTESGTVTLNSADNEKNFADVKKYFGTSATSYVDRIEKAVTIGSTQYLFQFFNNGRFFIFKRSGTSGGWGNAYIKGNYDKGGKYLVVTDGHGKGRVAERGDVTSNLKSLL